MSCGTCGGTPLPQMVLKAREAMCHYCPKRKTCAKTACPLRRWPDDAGIVRWWRMEWYGVPYPIKVRLALHGAWVALRLRLAKDYLPGCGCNRWLKDRWVGLKSLVNGLVRSKIQGGG